VAGPRTIGFLERSRFIPLRLSADERRLLHLLEAALSVSAYTDKVSPIAPLQGLQECLPVSHRHISKMPFSASRCSRRSPCTWTRWVPESLCRAFRDVPRPPFFS
jgi:hypothetical protein